RRDYRLVDSFAGSLQQFVCARLVGVLMVSVAAPRWQMAAESALRSARFARDARFGPRKVGPTAKERVEIAYACLLDVHNFPYRPSIFVSIALLPKVEHAFLKRVSIPHHQDSDEAKHAPENHAAPRDRFLVNDRPRIHEHDLEVEEDEQHRHEIELHAEARLSLALRNHPAFVSGVLRRSTLTGFTEH